MSLGDRPVLSDADFSYTPNARKVSQLSGLDEVYDVPSAPSPGWSFALLEAGSVGEVGGGCGTRRQARE